MGAIKAELDAWCPRDFGKRDEAVSRDSIVNTSIGQV